MSALNLSSFPLGALSHAQPPIKARRAKKRNRDSRNNWLRNPSTTNAAKWSEAPAFVYLFVHQSEARMKIGVSIEPLNRLSQLPEARDVAIGRSYVIKLPNAKRAYEIERLLHKALKPDVFQVQFTGKHDGYTEWFNLQALPVALRIVQSTPCTSASTGTLLVEPLSYYLPNAAWGAEQAAAAHNEQVVQQAIHLLLQVANVLPVSVINRVQSGQGQALTLVFHGFHDWARQVNSMSSLRAIRVGDYLLRSRVLNLENFALADVPKASSQAGESILEPSLQPLPKGSVVRSWRPTPSLISSISYASGTNWATPGLTGDDLLIRFQSLHQIAKWPGGKEITARLRVLFAQLELISAQGRRGEIAVIASQTEPPASPRHRAPGI